MQGPWPSVKVGLVVTYPVTIKVLHIKQNAQFGDPCRNEKEWDVTLLCRTLPLWRMCFI